MSAINVVRFPETPTEDASTYAAAHRHVGAEFLAAPEHPSHFVQFYEDESTLFEMVGQFLLSGARTGDRLLVISTPEHRDGFLRKLEEEAGGLSDASQLTWLDARETLSRFMVGGMPDRARFAALLSQVIRKLMASAPQTCLRAYGEMVDLLWRDGNADAALRLEDLWNDAGKEHAFSLFCAYSVGNFYKEGSSSRFYEVCRQHTHVIPTESATRAKALEREIEQRKRLEDALRVALRNRTKAEEELRDSLRREQQARAEAEGAATFRELFLGIVGHDLRNPLNTILNTARVMMLRREVEGDARARTDRIISSGMRMQRMIEQILDVTRARLAGGIPVIRTWQDVDPIVSKIVEETRAAHPWREIRYERRGDCWASIDADRYEQVVSNLVQNAVNHGSPGGPVTVTLRCDAPAIHLAVHNMGKPIDPAFVPYLFDPFSRTQKMPGKAEGLGLGLYIVDCISRAHQGIVSVSSSEQTGTTFEVTMPRHERDVPA